MSVMNTFSLVCKKNGDKGRGKICHPCMAEPKVMLKWENK